MVEITKLIKQQGKNIVTLDRIIRVSQTDFYTARAYEKQVAMSDHGNRISQADGFYGDISMRSNHTEKETKKDFKDAYALIDLLFPELIGHGIKNEGYATYTLDEIQKSGIITERNT